MKGQKCATQWFFKGVRVVLKVAICKGLVTFLAISPELFYQISYFFLVEGGRERRGVTFVVT